MLGFHLMFPDFCLSCLCFGMIESLLKHCEIVTICLLHHATYGHALATGAKRSRWCSRPCKPYSWREEVTWKVKPTGLLERVARSTAKCQRYTWGEASGQIQQRVPVLFEAAELQKLQQSRVSFRLSTGEASPSLASPQLFPQTQTNPCKQKHSVLIFRSQRL